MYCHNLKRLPPGVFASDFAVSPHAVEDQIVDSHKPTPMKPKAPYYQAISALGKKVMEPNIAEGETMHLAPLGWRNARDA